MYPEYESAKELAKKNDIPLKEVYNLKFWCSIGTFWGILGTDSFFPFLKLNVSNRNDTNATKEET